ncbi:hypothetical protein J5N97_015621 [Dioscorea zingiberensis]|uniref:HVA22-like protein n=1 Tax=Dioscorea zingiberensis TaxID=325984 RepID=A0A9D5CHW6_9LILI|nr:hypothetical protein J5N97_015621 [Dioscorea zingiberensis]
MALIGGAIPSEVGLRLLLCPLGSNVVIRTACCTVGIGLPVYSTFKAIESRDRSEQEKWLVYWAAYGSFSLAEIFLDKFLYWCPFYYHMKFAFLVWLQLPTTNGSRKMYRRHLRPFLLRHQARLDQLLNATSNEIAKFVMTHQNEIQFVKSVIGKCAMTVRDIIQSGQIRGHNLMDDPNSLALARSRIQDGSSAPPPTRPQIEDPESDADD